MREVTIRCYLALLLAMGAGCGTSGGGTPSILDDITDSGQALPDGQLDGLGDLPAEQEDLHQETLPADEVDSTGTAGDTDSSCVPACDGKACGEDGCGGTCGQCGEGKLCEDGLCIPVLCQEGQACDDLNACSFDDICTDGICTGTPYTCDDEKECTQDSCDGAGDCVFSLLDKKCLINNVCYSEGDLRTGNPCEECNPTSGKTEWTKDDTNLCSDSNACTVGDSCLDGTCIPGNGTLVCENPGPCKSVSCDPELGCVVAYADGPCDDANVCTVGDTCLQGACSPGTIELECAPASCLSAVCDAVEGCLYSPAAGPCDDGDACTENDVCDTGKCLGGTLKAACNDNNPCTDDSCVDNGKCINAFNKDGCSDGNECTTGDVCSQGQCGGTLKDCNDNNVCTDDYCNPFLPGGCNYQMNDNSCSDNDPCTLGDTCSQGSCLSGLGKPDCDDKNACTSDACTPFVGCTHTNLIAFCSDGNACTDGDYCANGTCVSGTSICQCQMDSDCAPLEDSDLCNGKLFCDMTSRNPANWGCKVDPSTVVTCSPLYDTNCLKNTCTPASGTCAYQPINQGGPCDDNDGCTLNDACLEGTCIGSPCSILNLYCVNGACGAQLCIPNTSRCDGDGVKLCNNTGTAETTLATCSPTQYCAQSGATAFCAPQVCVPNALSCEAARVMVCDAIGSMLTEVQDCTTTQQWCVQGMCQNLFLCGGAPCPALAGYTVSCNSKLHCEYANADPTGWKQWDTWIYVPAGSFEMGASGESSHTDEIPVHTVTFSNGYFIAKYEAVVEAYEACVAAGTCSAASTADATFNGWGTNSSSKGRSNHPQNGLTWQQGQTFCAWLAGGGRLPTEAEWENAASGTPHIKYPWGDTPAPSCTNGTAVFNELGGTAGYGCAVGGTWPVGSKPAGESACGAMDMSGNVWEQCQDWYGSTYYQSSPAQDPAGPTSGTLRVTRGGAFDNSSAAMRCSNRSYLAPTQRYANTGARCARPEPAPMDYVVWPVCTPGSIGCTGTVRGTCNAQGSGFTAVEDCTSSGLVCKAGLCVEALSSCTATIRYANGARFTFFESTTSPVVLAAASASLLTDNVGKYWLGDTTPDPHSELAPWNYIIDFGCRKSVTSIQALFPYNYDSFKTWSIYYTTASDLNADPSWTLAGSYSESGFLASLTKSFPATPANTRGIKIVVTASSRGTAATYNPDLGSIRVD